MQLTRFVKNIFQNNMFRKTDVVNRMHSVENFYRALERERNRADRTGMQFALVSFQIKKAKSNGKNAEEFAYLICSRVRNTDEIGWIDHRHIGLLLFNTDRAGAQVIISDIEKAISDPGAVPDHSVYVYPSDSRISTKGDGDKEKAQILDEDRAQAGMRASDVELTDAVSGMSEKSDIRVSPNALADGGESEADIKPLLARRMPVWKRLLDITGTLLALIVFSPLFLVISLLIKVASPGPILFKQDRIGYGGREFSFLKFRTMKPDADTTTHQEYLAELINNGDASDDAPMIKLDDHNPQIIPFGKLIRKTYLDELPQLFNVLRGDMSLVGPRPPIPYEVAEYRMWHNGRFNTIPGMTGLWQVSGKNRLTFKEMIRLDIQYYRNLSFLSEIKILFMTPYAILTELMANRQKENILGEGDN